MFSALEEWELPLRPCTCSIQNWRRTSHQAAYCNLVHLIFLMDIILGNIHFPFYIVSIITHNYLHILAYPPQNLMYSKPLSASSKAVIRSTGSSAVSWLLAWVGNSLRPFDHIPFVLSVDSTIL